METVGFVITVASLVTFVSTVTDCVDCIQLGRTFGKDFGKAQLRLDLVKLRISRWGHALGGGNLGGAVAASEKEMKLAARALGNIKSLLDEAQTLSRRFAPGQAPAAALAPSPSDGSAEPLEVCSEDDLEGLFARMHAAVSGQAKRRQRATGLVKKARWAIHDKKKFDNLLEELDMLVSGLETTIPSCTPVLREICTTDVNEIRKHDDSSVEGLKLLKEVNGEDDKIFEEAAAQEIEKAYGHTWERTEVSDDATILQGDQILGGAAALDHIPAGLVGGHKYGVTVIKGRVKATQGNIYGGTGL